jgi:hypothetical protein
MALALSPLLAALAHDPSLLDPAPSLRPPTIERTRELPLVHGGVAAPTAWLALWRGDAWVCWTAAADCWQRLDLAGVVDLATLRAEFVDRSTLVLADRSDQTWLIVRGDPGPRPVAWTANPRASPGPRECGPEGSLPIAGDASLSFIHRPCAEAPGGVELCVRPGRSLRLRPGGLLRLRLGVELRALVDWQRAPGVGGTQTGLAWLAVLAVALDPAAWIQQRRERADLQAQARPALRALPPLRTRGPLAAAERQHLRDAICGGAR